MELLLKYFPNLSEKQIFQFSQLQDLYHEWNSKINVISRRDIENLYIKHVLHSLFIAKFIEFKDESKILDVGTGGGFPGIPLSIFFPNASFLLVDSIGKKIKVVKEISSSIGLKNLIAQHKRVEHVEDKFDFIVSRAVTDMNTFKGWVDRLVSKDQKNELKNGILCLKGGDLSNEISGIKNIQQINLSDYFEEDFFKTKKLVYIFK